mmetsp:Transcript_13218/g.41347  ORF Transcript_13218/g.41347 Transcript_13218/m.41347 type:complete len:284 (-) Transcript_13218:2370-3221(-)
MLTPMPRRATAMCWRTSPAKGRRSYCVGCPVTTSCTRRRTSGWPEVPMRGMPWPRSPPPTPPAGLPGVSPPTCSLLGGIRRSHRKCARPCSSCERCRLALPSSAPRKTPRLSRRTLSCAILGTWSNSKVSFHAGENVRSPTRVRAAGDPAMPRMRSRTKVLQLDARTPLRPSPPAAALMAMCKLRASITRTTTLRITLLEVRLLSVSPSQPAASREADVAGLCVVKTSLPMRTAAAAASLVRETGSGSSPGAALARFARAAACLATAALAPPTVAACSKITRS